VRLGQRLQSGPGPLLDVRVHEQALGVRLDEPHYGLVKMRAGWHQGLTGGG